MDELERMLGPDTRGKARRAWDNLTSMGSVHRHVRTRPAADPMNVQLTSFVTSGDVIEQIHVVANAPIINGIIERMENAGSPLAASANLDTGSLELIYEDFAVRIATSSPAAEQVACMVELDDVDIDVRITSMNTVLVSARLYNWHYMLTTSSLVLIERDLSN